jgi:hypothetical protein
MQESRPNKWQESVNRIKHSLPIKDKKFDPDCVAVRMRSSQENYLQEVATGFLGKRKVPPMTDSEREKCQLTYKDEKLYTADGAIAHTTGCRTKKHKNSKAFVMSKEGILYLFDHGKKGKTEDRDFATHGVVLGEKPAEMAGVISINKEGKIVSVVDDSGHYAPTQLDMYRFITRLKKEMPKALDQYCTISWRDDELYEQVSSSLTNFIERMEGKPYGGTKPKHETLRDERIEKAEEYKELLKTKVAEAKAKIPKKGGPLSTILSRGSKSASAQSIDTQEIDPTLSY